VITWSLKGMLWHLAEEELQHRGEANALLWQEDVKPPVTSWWWWANTLPVLAVRIGVYGAP
jgi:uncharacterized damage-inducible protein DinB